MAINVNAIIMLGVEGEVMLNGFPQTKWKIAEIVGELLQVHVCTLAPMMEFIVPKIAPPTPNANTAGTILTTVEKPCAMIAVIIPFVVVPKTTLRTMMTNVRIVKRLMNESLY